MVKYCYLIFWSQVVTLRTTRINIQKVWMVLTMHFMYLLWTLQQTATFAIKSINILGFIIQVVVVTVSALKYIYSVYELGSRLNLHVMLVLAMDQWSVLHHCLKWDGLNYPVSQEREREYHNNNMKSWQFHFLADKIQQYPVTQHTVVTSSGSLCRNLAMWKCNLMIRQH
jgi:hypothetical protein